MRFWTACWLAPTWAVLLAWVLVSGPALATEPATPENRVSFQVESSRNVENDWVTAVVGVTAEDPDPAKLASRVNDTMQWALEQGRTADGVKLKSGGYRTSPIHDKSRIQHWRASQDLILESADVDRLASLVGTLQSRLQLVSIGFSVSPESRRATEAELIDEVLARFRARAERISRNLGASSYKIIELSIQTPAGGPIVPLRAHAGRSLAKAEVAPPALEGGTTRLMASVRGTIELD